MAATLAVGAGVARFAPLPARRSAPRASAAPTRAVAKAAHSLTARRALVEQRVPMVATARRGSTGRELGLRVVSVDDPDNPDLDAQPIMSGRPNALWRVLSCLPYLVPLMGSLAFGTAMYDSHPLFSVLILVFQPLLQVPPSYHNAAWTRPAPGFDSRHMPPATAPVRIHHPAVALLSDDEQQVQAPPLVVDPCMLAPGCGIGSM